MDDIFHMAKRELLQYRYWLSEMHEIQKELDGCASPSAFEETIQSNLRSRMRALSAQCYILEHKIDQLPLLEKEVLRHRYISGFVWEDIAEKLGCDLEQTERTHQKALKLYVQMHYDADMQPNS